MPGDVGKRIVVLHQGQVSQCSHCLRRAGAGCPAMGIGKACNQMRTPRAKMNIYMQSLRDKIGYVSMKIKFTERQSRMFPSMLGLPGELSSEQELQGVWQMNENSDNADHPILTPIEEKDQIISEQNSKIKVLLENHDELPKLKATLEKVEKENNVLKKKITFTRKATEKKILENIGNDIYEEDPHLVCVLSATMDENDFDFVEAADDLPVKEENQPASPKLEHRSRKEIFLSSIEDSIDMNNEVDKERLCSIQNQVLERLKSTKLRKHRSRTGSGSSCGPLKRPLVLSDDEQTGRTASRPRTASSADQ